MLVTDTFIKNLEIKYLRILTELLKKGKIDKKYAQDSAKKFLTLLPFSSDDDVHDKVKSFSEKFEFLSPLHAYVVKEIDQNKTNQVLEKMRNLIKENKIDEAVKTVQQSI